MPTIKDVAKKSKVSIATVSRVINNNYPVNEKTKQTVLDTIDELGYKPNLVARSLKNKETKLLGMVVPDISNPYYMNIAKGIESVLSPLGFSLLFSSTDYDTSKEIKILEVLQEQQVSNVFLATSIKDSDQLNKFIKNGLNIIMVDTMVEDLNCSCVTENNYSATYKLTEELIANGHKRIALVHGDITFNTAFERYNGFMDACIDKDILVEISLCVDGGLSKHISHKVVTELLKQKPTAIVSANNEMTEGSLLAIIESGLSIPKDISLVSYGDIRNADLISPSLTIIKQEPFKIGKLAGDILVRKLNGNEDYETITIDDKLYTRNSIKNLNI